MKRPPVLAAILCAASALPLAGAGARQDGPPPPTPVRVDAVLLEEVQQKRRVTGEVRAARRSLVASREPGLVDELLVREGTRVEAGEVLARLDSAHLELEIAVVAAQETLAAVVVDEHTASAAQARLDLDVLEKLAERDAVNPKELADARTAVTVAEARLGQAGHEILVLAARRRLLERRVADMQPRAPFAGFVAARHTEAGEWVDAGGALVELMSAQHLEAWLDVPQAHFAAVSRSSGPFWIDVDAGGSLKIEEWRLVPSVESRGRSFPLIVTLPADSGLAPGMSLTAALPTEERREHLTLARDALLLGEAGSYVYVAQATAEGAPPVATISPVEVLFSTSPERVAVRAPRLTPGALVVVEGNERLYPGAALAPQERESR